MVVPASQEHLEGPARVVKDGSKFPQTVNVRVAPRRGSGAKSGNDVTATLKGLSKARVAR